MAELDTEAARLVAEDETIELDPGGMTAELTEEDRPTELGTGGTTIELDMGGTTAELEAIVAAELRIPREEDCWATDGEPDDATREELLHGAADAWKEPLLDHAAELAREFV